MTTARTCLFLYSFSPLSEVDALRAYGAAWVQTEVDASGGWCATKVRSALILPEETEGGRDGCPHGQRYRGALSMVGALADVEGFDELMREMLFRSGLRVRFFDRPAARIYGPLRVRLEGLGRPPAEPDLRIASIALARDLTLVTGNVRHFDRVPDLRVENWLAQA